MRYSMVLLLGLFFASCTNGFVLRDIAAQTFVGCWENENGFEREGWTIDPSGWLIGYAASRDEEGNITFFEHMRIERNGETTVLVVTGQDNSETRFMRNYIDNPNEFRFENPDHDYPQVIVYQRNGDALNAYIDLIDGGKKVRFNKSKCKGN